MNEDLIIEVDEYNAVCLDNYNGTFGLYGLQKGGGTEGVFYKVWVFLSKWNRGNPIPTDKKRPMAVRLGDRQTAKRTLQALLEQVDRI